MLLDGGAVFGGDTRLAYYGVQAVQAAEGVEVALADPAGVGNQIARIDLAKGELLDAALVHVGRGHVAVQNTVGADKRRIDAQRAQGILGRGPHKGGGAAAVHAAHQAQLAILARLEQAKGRKRIGHIDESQLVGDSESANAISRRLRSLSQLDTQSKPPLKGVVCS